MAIAPLNLLYNRHFSGCLQSLCCSSLLLSQLNLLALIAGLRLSALIKAIPGDFTNPQYVMVKILEGPIKIFRITFNSHLEIDVDIMDSIGEMATLSKILGNQGASTMRRCFPMLSNGRLILSSTASLVQLQQQGHIWWYQSSFRQRRMSRIALLVE